MPKYIIERDVPGLGKLSQTDLQGMAQRSNAVLRQLAPKVQWVTSYVTDDKMYCVYIADNVELVREHATRGQFPANRISEIRNVVDPTAGE